MTTWSIAANNRLVKSPGGLSGWITQRTRSPPKETSPRTRTRWCSHRLAMALPGLALTISSKRARHSWQGRVGFIMRAQWLEDPGPYPSPTGPWPGAHRRFDERRHPIGMDLAALRPAARRYGSALSRRVAWWGQWGNGWPARIPRVSRSTMREASCPVVLGLVNFAA